MTNPGWKNPFFCFLRVSVKKIWLLLMTESTEITAVHWQCLVAPGFLYFQETTVRNLLPKTWLAIYVGSDAGHPEFRTTIKFWFLLKCHSATLSQVQIFGRHFLHQIALHLHTSIGVHDRETIYHVEWKVQISVKVIPWFYVILSFLHFENASSGYVFGSLC